MSHFTVSVILDSDDQEALEKALQPFHEYECTGVDDEYVVWVDEHDDKVSEYENEDEETKKEYPTLADYMLKYQEYEPDDAQNGRWGRKTNPNKKWDWWVVGGRWGNSLLLKSGEKADYAQKKHIDFDGMISQNQEKRIAEIDRYIEIVNGRHFFSFSESRDKFNDIDDARKFYREQQVIKDLRDAEINSFYGCVTETYKRGDKEAYLANAEYNAFGSYAVLKDGVWHSKGDMGWWGMSSNENDDWPQKFGDLINETKDNQWIVIVDCHI